MKCVQKPLKLDGVEFIIKQLVSFIPDECSPRFDITTKEGTPWVGFKNMEQISDKPLEVNLEYMRRLKQDYPNKVIVASIMGSNDEEWTTLAKSCYRSWC